MASIETKLELSKPTKVMIEKWLNRFQEHVEHGLGLTNKTLSEKLLGLNFSEIEDFALSVQRRYILGLPETNIKKITTNHLKHLKR